MKALDAAESEACIREARSLRNRALTLLCRLSKGFQLKSKQVHAAVQAEGALLRLLHALGAGASVAPLTPVETDPFTLAFQRNCYVKVGPHGYRSGWFVCIRALRPASVEGKHIVWWGDEIEAKTAFDIPKALQILMDRMPCYAEEA